MRALGGWGGSRSLAVAARSKGKKTECLQEVLTQAQPMGPDVPTPCYLQYFTFIFGFLLGITLLKYANNSWKVAAFSVVHILP